MGQTNLTAINVQTVSINGTPISGSGPATGTVTNFDALDASAVLAINGVVKSGSLPAGATYTNFNDVNVSALTVNGSGVS